MDDAMGTAQASPEDGIAFIESLARAFNDARYGKVDGKPIVIISDLSTLPRASETVSRWRKHALQMGWPGLYLIASTSRNTSDSQKYGFDAVVKFPATGCNDQARDITNNIEFIDSKFAGRVFEYGGLEERRDKLANLRLASFEAVMPAWDNQVLAPAAGTSFDGAAPEEYAKWLSRAVAKTSKNRSGEQLLFIHAWNAWNEGAHLEPDQRHGYGYLHATACVLLNHSVPQNEQTIAMINQSFVKRSDSVVIVHIYYEDLIDSIFDSYLTAAQNKCDLIVSVMNNASASALRKIKAKFENCFILATENRGRDIRPFIIAFRKANELGYRFGCKVHTKKSMQLNQGDEWRTHLFESLLCNEDHIGTITQRFTGNPTLGLLATERTLYDLAEPVKHFGNKDWLNKLLARMDRKR